MIKSILITGCNRGIGLSLIRNLVKEENPLKNIIATCRNFEKAQDLQKIANHNKNLHILKFDVTNFASFPQFFEKVSDIVKDDGLNVLFNNAGVSPKFTRINYVKVEQMIDTFTVNTVAPIMLTKTMLPLLKKASKNNSGNLSTSKAAVINMTSTLGSISTNTDGGLHPYRCSKSALNMATKSLSIDLNKDGILVVGIHPGWVKTAMGGPNATLDVETSATSILNLLKKIDENYNGKCYDYDGKLLEL